MELFTVTNYFKFLSQSSVYLTTKINRVNGKSILLVGTLPRKIFSIEYDLADHNINHVVKDLHFAYIPAGAEMVSMTAFNKSRILDEFAIGITIIRNTEAGTECYLNIYCDNDTACNNELNLENIAQNCENIELDFTPYGLYHIVLPPPAVDNKYEVVWLLSGSDERIHVYKELEEEHVHYEMSVDDFFPEFVDINGIVLSLDIQYYHQWTRRISCMGYESGRFIYRVVDINRQEITYSVSNNFESIVYEVKFFTISAACDSYHNVINNDEYSVDMECTELNPNINLLIVSTNDGAVTFMNILERMLEDHKILSNTTDHDIVTCSLAADTDLDGNRELLLGTYSHDVLIYKFFDVDEKWKLLDTISFSGAIHKLYYIDLTQDGTCQLSVVTTNGIHIHQHDHRYISKILNERLRNMIMKTESTSAETL